MKKNKKNLIVFTLLLLLWCVLSVNGKPVRAGEVEEEILDYGKDGNLEWKIDSSGCLTINGEGDYTTDENGDPVWVNSEYRTQINRAVINVKNIHSAAYMFHSLIYLKNIDFTQSDFSQLTDMKGMFDTCYCLTDLDLSNFNTNDVTDMSYMFNMCLALTGLNLGDKFDTSNVTDMSRMFTFCSHLTDLDLSNFNTSNVTNMSMMFYNTGMSELNLNNFDTGNVTDMSFMFYYCIDLTKIDLSNFNTSNVIDMNNMFSHSIRLSGLDLSNFDTSNVTDMSDMFSLCAGLTELDLSNFDIGNVTDTNDMFSFCNGLTSIISPRNVKCDISLPYVENYIWIDTNKNEVDVIPAESASTTYTRCYHAPETGGDGEQGSGTDDKEYEYKILWDGTVEITSYSGEGGNVIIPSEIDGKRVTSIGECAFKDCRSLTGIELPSSVRDIGKSAFENCTGLKHIKLPYDWCGIGDRAFFGCSSVEILEMPGGAIHGPATFEGCPTTMVVYVVKGSGAEDWAKREGYTVKYYGEETTDTPNTPQPPNIPNTSDKEQIDGAGTQPTLPAVGTKQTVSNGVYKVTKSSATSKEVTFTKPKNSKKTSITIPATIKIDGQTYKVTEIASKAFKNNKKLKSVTVGKNVKKIGKEVFSGCSKLNKVTIKSTVLKSVGKNAIKNINKKATIKCPKKQLAKYKKLFKSSTGYKKTMKIKK